MPDSQQSNPSGPRRRLRRNSFREGPDFLFLATQNGRPVEGSARPRQLEWSAPSDARCEGWLRRLAQTGQVPWWVLKNLPPSVADAIRSRGNRGPPRPFEAASSAAEQRPRMGGPGHRGHPAQHLLEFQTHLGRDGAARNLSRRRRPHRPTFSNPGLQPRQASRQRFTNLVRGLRCTRRVCRLLQLPPAKRSTGLDHAGWALRRHPVHRPGL